MAGHINADSGIYLIDAAADGTPLGGTGHVVRQLDLAALPWNRGGRGSFPRTGGGIGGAEKTALPPLPYAASPDELTTVDIMIVDSQQTIERNGGEEETKRPSTGPWPT